MLDRLQIVKQRFDEISDLIIQPDVISDQKRYVQLNQEYKGLKALAEKRDEYVLLMANIDEANEIIADNSDADMTEMAKMQLEEAKERLPELEEEIKFMLIPKDEEDAKNVMVEIRAGTGGDESGLFAADLLRNEIHEFAGLHPVERIRGDAGRDLHNGEAAPSGTLQQGNEPRPVGREQQAVAALVGRGVRQDAMRRLKPRRADARADGGDHRTDFIVLKHFVQPRLLHVDEFAAQRQNCLELSITPLLGRATCGITFN